MWIPISRKSNYLPKKSKISDEPGGLQDDISPLRWILLYYVLNLNLDVAV